MTNTSPKKRFSITLLVSILILFFIIFAFFYFKKQLFSNRVTVNEDVMVSKITRMGKLELVKYAMKDVIEKKKNNRFLPDESVLFVAVGEVTGCIDLTKITKDDIVTLNDSVTVFLPKPEICYSKIDHQKSKVYDVSGALFPSDAKELVEDIYKEADRRILQNAREMNILKKTEENAAIIFKPLLENMSGKKVGLRFKQ